ncbi:McrC family protein [Aliarcobacter cryaerophilus]|uniref:McrC family protein n=1 Tax=Aliarcobacter cryaerophilus TaxID=28198 RepID=UPI00082A815A|nr:McrC family protein [Aliarcobacter cryaerophilus]
MILKEYSFLQTTYKDNKEYPYIKPDTFEALEKFVLENEETAQYLKITTKKGFGKVLQAQNYVGVIQTKDGTTIEILPKIKNATIEKSKEILIKMLKTLKNSPFKNSSVANLKSSKIPLFEIFISMFLEELAILVRNGIKSDYISKEENLKFLKGKLKISEQIKYNTIHKERFFVQYEEFISNRVENRLIKTTLQFLYNKSKLNKNQQRIREFLFVFDGIEISYNIKTDFSKIKLNRQMKDYEQVLLWCKTFLFENSFSPYKGNDIAFALLFDMNLLFESFVYSYLKKSSNFQDIKSQDRTHHLAYENGIGRFRLKPDIVINCGKIIADTKWKILSEDKAYNGVLQDDMYQLYAYGTKYANCEKIYLIYPFDELIIKNSYNYFKNKELKLDILFFDVYKKEFKGKNIEL